MIAVRKPTGGDTAVARKVTSGGPVTNTTSSTTDSKANAVCRCTGSSSTPAHRARTIEPMLGPLAPVRAARTSQVQIGVPSSTATTKPTPASA